MASLAERLNYKKSGSNRERVKEHQRSSKRNIEQALKLERNGKLTHYTDVNDNSCTPTYITKSVVVQKNEKGYGLILCGDNPVYVQSVKEDGASAKAGILSGDKIIKVNGQSVTDLNHVEVVKLIKAGNHVTLTLHRNPVSSNTASPSQASTTNHRQSNFTDNAAVKQLPKRSLHDGKIVTMKKMVEKERAEVERIKEEYARKPEPKMLKQLCMAKKIKEDLEKELWKAERLESNADMMPAPPVSVNEVVDTDAHTKLKDDPISLTEMDNADQMTSTTCASNRNPANSEPVKQRREQARVPSLVTQSESDSSMASRTHPTAMEFLNEFSDDSTLAEERISPSPQQNKHILNFEDDDSLADNDAFQDHGPFSDLELLRQRPAHLAVFFNYVLLSHNPADFLFTMALNSYKQLSSTKDMLKQASVIYKTYLAVDAPFKMTLDGGIPQRIQSFLATKSPVDEALKCVFDPALEFANKEVRNQLAQYRMKREQGLGSLFGDEKLQHVIHLDQQTDIRIVDEIILPTLTDLVPRTPSDETEQKRLKIKQDALRAFLNQYGSKRVKNKPISVLAMLKPKTAQSPVKTKTPGSMSSLADDPNGKKGKVGIFGVKAKRKSDASTSDKSRTHYERAFGMSSKKDKRHIWENPSAMLAPPLQPTIVGSPVSSDHVVTVATKEEENPFSQNAMHGALTDSFLNPFLSSQDAQSPHDGGHSEGSTSEVQSASQDWGLTEMENFGYAYPTDDNESDARGRLSVDASAQERPGSFRRPNGDHRRNGPHKSHSDPNKNDVELAVGQHNAFTEQLEQIFRSSLQSSSESTLPIEDRMLMEHFPSLSEDPEIDIDTSEQLWLEMVPENVTQNLNRKEIRRQQVMNELLYTEQHHVRDLKILEKLFYEPLMSEGLLNDFELNQAFPNLKAILDLHRELNRSLQETKEKDGYIVKEIGDLLLARFDGEGGNSFKEECAVYCGNQSTVLSLIKDRSKKDQKFSQFLHVAQKHPICRKLHLKDFVPMEFQRLTKYPLLLENIIKNTEEEEEGEVEKLRKAFNRCREILAFVNQAVKEAEDKQKMIEIQTNLDREPIMKLKTPLIKEFKNIDLTERPVLLQGPLTLRVGQMDKRKEIAIHCILYDNVLVLLQKHEERYILKCQGTQSGEKYGGGATLDPFITMKSVIVRNVATDRRAFFVMPMSDKGPQMYEFVAASTAVSKQWVSFLTETSKNKETSASSGPRRKAFAVGGSSRDDQARELTTSLEQPVLQAGELLGRGEQNHPENMLETASSSHYSDPSSAILLSKIQSKHEDITGALSAKLKLLAELSGLEERQLEELLEMSIADSDPDPGILIKHSILCVDKLTGLLNDCATPDKVFVKQLAKSRPDITGPNQLPEDLSEGDSQSNSNVASPLEKWATPLPRPRSTNNMRSPLPIQEWSSTLSLSSDRVTNATETIPYGEEGETLPSQLTRSEDDVLYDAPESLRSEDTENRDDNSKNLTVPDDASSEQSKSRPVSGIELTAKANDVQVHKMMDIMMNLQTQLTQLMHVTDQREQNRLQLRQENLQLRQELEKKKSGQVSNVCNDVRTEGR